jgi:hypothetical protein
LGFPLAETETLGATLVGSSIPDGHEEQLSIQWPVKKRFILCWVKFTCIFTRKFLLETVLKSIALEALATVKEE